MQGERRRRNEGWQEEERELIRDQDRDAGVNISGEESGVRGLGSSRRRRKERKCRKDGGSKPEVSCFFLVEGRKEQLTLKGEEMHSIY